jgi:hypothetical protein
MRAKQVSVFVENQPGRLADVLSILSKEGINIRALAIADTADFGIVRLILSDVDKGIAALRGAGLSVRTTDVLQLEIPDVPGGLNEALVKPLAAAGINVEYIYAHVLPAPGKATVLVKVRDIEKAERVLGLK